MADFALRKLPVFPFLFPKSLSQLRPDDRTLAPISLKSELTWMTAVFGIYESRLNRILCLKRQVEAAILDGSYEGAGAAGAINDLYGGEAIEAQSSVRGHHSGH
jgi:hypothetical protein